jgi:phospholipid/cholesterol/gamma-HCH transport system substrate-binding protein
MRRDRVILAGGFAAGVLIILAGPLLYRLGSRLIWPVRPYRAVFSNSVAGLKPGDEVEMRGVRVGRVTKVDLTEDSPPRIAVQMEVAAQTPVRRDTTASVGTSADGKRIIELRGGTAAAGELSPGDQIATEDVSEAQLQTEQMSKAASEILASLSGRKPEEKKKTSRQLSDMLADADAVLKNLRTLTADLSAPARIDTINSTLDNLHDASARLSHVMQTTDIAVDHAAELMKTFSAHRQELYSDLRTALQRLNQTLDNAQIALASANHLMSSANLLVDSNAADVERTIRQISLATVRLNETLETIQNDPSLLIWRGRASSRDSQ